MKKTHALMGLVAGLGLMMMACNSSSGVAAVASGDLIGKWLLNKEVTHGTVHEKGSYAGHAIDTTFHMDKDTTYTGGTYFMEFKSDSTYNSNMPDDTSGLAKVSAISMAEYGT